MHRVTTVSRITGSVTVSCTVSLEWWQEKFKVHKLFGFFFLVEMVIVAVVVVLMMVVVV